MEMRAAFADPYSKTHDGIPVNVQEPFGTADSATLGQTADDLGLLLER
jgi:hypothetical protein